MMIPYIKSYVAIHEKRDVEKKNENEQEGRSSLGDDQDEILHKHQSLLRCPACCSGILCNHNLFVVVIPSS